MAHENPISAKLAKRIANANKEPWESALPKWNPLDYDRSMFANLGYYNIEVESKQKQKWAIAYYKANKMDVSGFTDLNACYFNQVGVLVHLMERGAELNDKHKKFILTQHAKIVVLSAQEVEDAKARAKKAEESGIKVKSVQDKMNEQYSMIMSELDVELDNCFNGIQPFNVKKWFVQQRVSGPVSKRILSYYERVKQEISDAITESIGYRGYKKDEGVEGERQLAEGYSHVPKKVMKDVLAFVSDVVDSCTVIKAMKIAVPRKAKVVPAAKLVARMKYMEEFEELKLKSLHPTKIVGAQEVWFYNTKLRRIVVYKAAEGLGLSVKGTTILNFDPEKSVAKLVRKPEETIKGFVSVAKKSITAMFDAIKARAMANNGRTNSDMIILQVF